MTSSQTAHPSPRTTPSRVTHEVLNQPKPLEDIDLYGGDTPLREAVEREGGGWAADHLGTFGRTFGSAHAFELGHLANRNKPILKTHDRYGHRLDEVEYHPAYHELMTMACQAGVHSMAWTAGRPGAHVARGAMLYLVSQPEAGIACPLTMTHACVPSLRNQPDLAAYWEPLTTRTDYDPRPLPPEQKRGLILGMAMTEKQGGSDVRANTTIARPIGAGGAGGEHALNGHKWFCSAPMSDAFLTLAYVEDPRALSCFLVPRWLPDGTRNPFFIQRLKDKLGNHANASSEVEYDGTFAWMVGEPGRGVATIIEMVHHTRLDVALGASGVMRQALTQALDHCRQRKAFGRLLIDQPLMRNVLADLALELEAATALAIRMAGAFDRGVDDENERSFARIGTAISKYWLAKRAPGVVVEALECHGGMGYVEESIMARLYREAPLGSIWEGSGNVQCLDVLRAMRRQPESVPALFAELEKARGGDRRYDSYVDALKVELDRSDDIEVRSRRLVEKMALALQGAQLVQHAPPEVADAFCATRLGGDWGNAYGTLPAGLDLQPILDRAQAG